LQRLKGAEWRIASRDVHPVVILEFNSHWTVTRERHTVVPQTDNLIEGAKTFIG
jgi:hypothetical protein